jgi:carboxyl-terminal processing protease
MKKHFHGRLLLHPSVAIVLSLALLTATAPADDTKAEPISTPAEEKENLYEDALLLAKVIELIRQHYVDESKTKYQDLFHAALRGIVASLDPHSQFLDEEAFKELQEETDGDYIGIGIIVGEQEGRLIILTAFEDSPAAKAGIRPGDYLQKIDDTSTAGMTVDDVVKLLRGNKGAPVKITIVRTEKEEISNNKKNTQLSTTLTFEIKRDTIHVSSLKEVGLIPEKLAGQHRIGYIRLEQFGSATAEEFRTAIHKLSKQNVAALILDLRNNPGGLLDSAIEIASSFLPKNSLIISTEGRSPSAQITRYSYSEQPPILWPLVILINGFSASASEIVAGALKDHKRAILIGEKTFGKGSVQSVVALDEKNALRLTTAYYYTPSRIKIHGVGIAPDIAVPIRLEQERALYQHRWERFLKNPNSKTIDLTVSDPQLERAVSALKSVLSLSDANK